MPYAIHLRKSRADIEAEARGEGESLARHRKTLSDLAARLGLDVTAEYCEIISGDRLEDRPQMQRLLADVAAGMYDGVLDVEVSRLTRGDLIDQGRIINTFKYSGTKIITPHHTYDLSDDWDDDVITTDMMMSRREYKFIKRRLQAGRNASAAEGLWQSPAPFGYRKVKIQRGKGWTLEPDPQTAPLVRMIFEMYANDGVGGQKIADRLNALGSRTPRGHAWQAHSIVQLAQNPVYAGKVRWNDRVSTTRIVDGELVVKREKNPTPIISDGKHPPLVPPELWEAAQRARRSHDHVRKHTGAPTRNPLAGLVYCSCCGHSMVRRDNGGSYGSKYDMLMCKTKGCPTKAIRLSIVEQTILDTLAGWLTAFDQPGVVLPERTHSRADAINAARANIQRLNAQRERIFAAYEDGAYDSATFIRRRNDKDAEIAAAQDALSALEGEQTLTAEECIRAQLPTIKTALELYSIATDVTDKRRLLRSVIERVEYKKTVRCYRNQDPSKELELIITPKAPM